MPKFTNIWASFARQSLKMIYSSSFTQISENLRSSEGFSGSIKLWWDGSFLKEHKTFGGPFKTKQNPYLYWASLILLKVKKAGCYFSRKCSVSNCPDPVIWLIINTIKTTSKQGLCWLHESELEVRAISKAPVCLLFLSY